MSTAEQLLTADEFFLLEKPEFSELVRGVIVTMNPPGFRHGLICARIAFLLQLHLQENDVGRVLTNDSGVITEREPDTVRGSDVAFFSYKRLPREVTPVRYPDVVPNIVFEVHSPTNSWSEILEKVAEYLAAGVEEVCVVLPETAAVHVFYSDQPGVILEDDEELALPAPLDGLRLPVSAFFQT